MLTQTLEGIVLRHRPYGEADTLVTFLTKECGLVTGFAKGLRRGKSRKAGSLLLFTKTRFQLREGKGSLPLITEASALRHYACLEADLRCFTSSHLIAESILTLSKERDPMPKAYDALKASLKAMEESHDPLYVWIVFAIKLLSEQGLMTLSRDCHACQRRSTNASMYLLKRGAEMVCSSCTSGTAIEITDRVLRLLCGIPHFSFEQVWRIDVSDEDIKHLKEILSVLLPYHLEKPLKSFEMLQVL